MPRRELKSGKQVADWLEEIGSVLRSPGNMTLIGSAALLWHTYDRGIITELPEAADLLVPKLKRNEPRDRTHAEWAKRIGLLD